MNKISEYMLWKLFLKLLVFSSWLINVFLLLAFNMFINGCDIKKSNCLQLWMTFLKKTLYVEILDYQSKI